MYHIEAICDQALWLERGRVVKMGKPDVVARLYGESLVQSTERSDSAQQMAFHKGEAATLADVQPAPSINAQAVKQQAFLRGVTVSIDGQSDKNGQKLQARAGQSDLEIIVTFEYTLDLSVPTVAASIETQGGQWVTSFSTAFDQHVPAVDANGRGRIKLRCPKLPLLRGQYRISVFLACERLLHLYDQASPCAEFEVIDDGLEQGLVFIPHAWDEGELILTRKQ